MPEIKIKHVVSFSSEDKVYKSENILKAETYRKWKCATPGESKASIVLQFEKATQIHSIDIGNESSAFVEILVGRSSDTVNDFQVLLVASSFMSPLESRNETHTNRVRMFGPEKLSQNLKDQKWDCVQIVCSQPFNKNITYGLSFIKFHSPPEKLEEQPSKTETAAKKAPSRLGAFTIKYEDDDDDSPSLFQRNSQEKTDPQKKNIPGFLWKTAKILSARPNIGSLEREVYSCERCSYSTDKLLYYEKHLSIHIDFVSHDCLNCGEEFSDVTDLNRHMCGYQSEDKTYGCEYCTKEFACPSGLKKHMKRHTSFLSYTCEICQKKFKDRSELARHTKTHKGKKYDCGLCNKSFFEKKDLSRHVQSHSGAKPFKCTECGKQFGRKNDLLRHFRLHSGEKYYNCSYCGKEFYRKDKLNIHVRIHTGEKPFPCKNCGRRFSAKTDMIRHYRSHEFGSNLRASPSNLPLATELQIADS